MFSSGGFISDILFVALFHFLGVDAKCPLLYTGDCFNLIFRFSLFLCRSHFSESLASLNFSTALLHFGQW